MTYFERYRFDVIMSLHRRAYDLVALGRDETDFWVLLKHLCTTFHTCPVYQGIWREGVSQQFYKTAKLAFDFGMPKELAFPRIGDLDDGQSIPDASTVEATGSGGTRKPL